MAIIKVELKQRLNKAYLRCNSIDLFVEQDNILIDELIENHVDEIFDKLEEKGLDKNDLFIISDLGLELSMRYKDCTVKASFDPLTLRWTAEIPINKKMRYTIISPNKYRLQNSFITYLNNLCI